MSSDGHLGAADVGLGLRGYEGARASLTPITPARHEFGDKREPEVEACLAFGGIVIARISCRLLLDTVPRSTLTGTAA